jgi:hypothetical protein
VKSNHLLGELNNCKYYKRNVVVIELTSCKIIAVFNLFKPKIAELQKIFQAPSKRYIEVALYCPFE